MNKFSRIFEEHQLAAKAKATPKVKGNPVAAAIAAAKEAVAEKAKTDPEDSVNQPQASAKLKVKVKARRAKTTTKGKADPPIQLKPTPKAHSAQAKQPPQTDKTPRKRGRPANGKRSDPGWYGRTFYIRKQTDELLEDALFKLKREGIDLDKSQLVDALLNAWAQVELEKVGDFQIGEILEKSDAE
jgi:hypothetical protein